MLRRSSTSLGQCSSSAVVWPPNISSPSHCGCLATSRLVRTAQFIWLIEGVDVDGAEGADQRAAVEALGDAGGAGEGVGAAAGDADEAELVEVQPVGEQGDVVAPVGDAALGGGVGVAVAGAVRGDDAGVGVERGLVQQHGLAAGAGEAVAVDDRSPARAAELGVGESATVGGLDELSAVVRRVLGVWHGGCGPAAVGALSVMPEVAAPLQSRRALYGPSFMPLCHPRDEAFASLQRAGAMLGIRVRAALNRSLTRDAGQGIRRRRGGNPVSCPASCPARSAPDDSACLTRSPRCLLSSWRANTSR
jgi:hypothetical protein